MAAIRKLSGPRGTVWSVQVRRKGFAPVNRNFKNKSDAMQWAAETEAQLGRGVAIPSARDPSRNTPTYEVMQRYIKEVASQRPYTGKKEEQVLGRMIGECEFMKRPIGTITGEDIANWRNERLRTVLPSTVNREWNRLSSFFKHAIKEWRYHMPNGNPCQDAKRPAGANRARNSRWSEADIQTMMRATNWRADKQPVIIEDYIGWVMQIAVESAMRIGEICSLKVEDFYPEKRAVHLSRTKNGDERWVPLSSKAMSYFGFLIKGKHPQQFIFPRKESFGVVFRRVRDSVGLSHLTFHDTRHEATTRLSTKYANVLELSAVTGHRDLGSLKRYYNPDPLELSKKMG